MRNMIILGAVARRRASGGGDTTPTIGLVDSFSSAIDTAKWLYPSGGTANLNFETAGGTSANAGGSLVMQPPDSLNRFTGYQSTATNWNLVNNRCYVRARLGSSTRVGTTAQWGFYFTVGDTAFTPGNFAQFVLEDTGTTYQLSCIYNYFGVPGTTVNLAYDATAHAYLQIRDTGGDIFWEVSPTAALGSWTVVRQLSVDAGTPGTYAALNNTTIGLETQNYGPATGVIMNVDSINIA